MKVDVFSHILPEKYLAALGKKTKSLADFRETENRAVTDIELRLKVMDRYPDVVQVLTLSQPCLETLVTAKDAIELSRIANDELAELLLRYPDKFIGAAACLPLSDIDAALDEADRAITQLGLYGIQISTTVNEEPLNLEKFRPLFKKMVDLDRPIWIHPCSTKTLHEPLFAWLYETASAMRSLVRSGIFYDYPDIKFITHHSGNMIPMVEGRIKWMLSFGPKMGPLIRKPLDHFRKFYIDTATYGSTGALMGGYNFFGVDQMLFGTDAPLGPPFGLTSETISSIKRMDIPDNEKKMIFSQNAINLLGIAV